MCVCMWVCAQVRVPKESKESDLLELELQMAMNYLTWVLETKSGLLQEQVLLMLSCS